MCTWKLVCMHECGFRGQFCGPTFLLPSFGIWGSNSGYQAMSCTPVDHPAGPNLYIFSTKTIKGTKVIKRNFKLPLILYYWGHITLSFLELKVRVMDLFWLAAVPWPSGWHVYSQEASAPVLSKLCQHVQLLKAKSTCPPVFKCFSLTAHRFWV